MRRIIFFSVIVLQMVTIHAGEFTKWGNDKGVDIFFDYTAEVMSNVSGGERTGTGYNGLSSFGLDADLGEAFGWEGIILRLSGMDLHGSGISSRVGDMMGVSDIEGYGSIRLYESWLEKKFDTPALSLRAGMLLADEEFTILDTAGAFLNATFGWPEFISMNTVNTGPAFYIPALGGRLMWHPSETFYLQFGVFDGDTFDSPDGDDSVNRHGLHWGMGNGQGTMFMGEMGCHWNNEGDESLPGVFKLGIWHHSGSFDDFSGGSAHDGTQGFYASLEQMVYREYGEQGLAWFSRTGFAPENRNEVEQSFQIGVSYIGLLPGRDIDSFALGLSKASISRDLPGRTSETVVEAAYEYIFSDDFIIQPSVQWVQDPGAIGELEDALVFGLRVNLSF